MSIECVGMMAHISRRRGRLSVVGTGQGGPCLDLRRVSAPLAAAAAAADLVVIEGMGRAVSLPVTPSALLRLPVSPLHKRAIRQAAGRGPHTLHVDSADGGVVSSPVVSCTWVGDRCCARPVGILYNISRPMGAVSVLLPSAIVSYYVLCPAVSARWPLLGTCLGSSFCQGSNTHETLRQPADAGRTSPTDTAVPPQAIPSIAMPTTEQCATC